MVIQRREVSCYFRAGVGIVLAGERGEILAFERSDQPGSWQLPQGGLQPGESPRQAAEREVFEETGIQVQWLSYLDEHPAWLAYELPTSSWNQKTGRGQAQKWLLYRFTGSDSHIRVPQPDGEFSRFKRTTLAALTNEVVPFRRRLYAQITDYFEPRLAG